MAAVMVFVTVFVTKAVTVAAIVNDLVCATIEKSPKDDEDQGSV